MAALTELDQNPEQEVKTLIAMGVQLGMIRKRYPDEHPLNNALAQAYHALARTGKSYIPYLDKRYEVVDAKQ